MEGRKTNNSNTLIEDFLKIKAFVLMLWEHRRLFYKTCGCAIILALIIGFSIPKRYTAEVTLAPENSSETDMGGLSSLASMAGLNIGGLGNNDAIVPDLYPMVIRSKDFLIRMFDIPVITEDGELSTTYYDYLLHHQRIAWWGYPMVGIAKVKKMIMPKKKEIYVKTDSTTARRNYTYLSENERGAIGRMQNSITCSVDKKTGVITLTATEQDPVIAAVIVDSVRVALNDFIIDYRTSKACQDYEYMYKMYEQAKADYNIAQRAYAAFADANLNLMTMRAQAVKDNLENEMQLAYNVYSQMANQLQIVKAKIQEKTPVYTVIESATVPERASAPKKMLLMIGFVFLACVGTTGWIMWKQMLK